MDVTVLVVSCDRYSWLWDGWYNSFHKHFKANVPVHFVTEQKNTPDTWENITPILVGPGLTWSEAVLAALDNILSSSVFFSLEDYWPTQDMTHKDFMRLYSMFMERELLCLRCSHPCSFYKIRQDGSFLQDSKYLVSCQTSFWDKEYLSSCIVPSESPWEFEIKGTERIRKSGSAHRTAFYPLPWYEHVCIRGNLTQKGNTIYQAIKKG
jgi:hypothetical protein